MDDAILKLIDAISKLAPQVWAVLLKQTYSEASVYLVIGVILALVVYFLVRQATRLYDSDEDLEDQLNVCGIAGLAICCAILALIFFISAAQWFYNPEFYAIRFLLDRVQGK